MTVRELVSPPGALSSRRGVGDIINHDFGGGMPLHLPAISRATIARRRHFQAHYLEDVSEDSC